MLRDLLGWAFRRADVAPTFEADHCLVHHGAACRACADACPHDAVRVTRTVTIDPIDCTGCGLCVAACPSHALTPVAPVEPHDALRCSRVAGEATSVTCLARLQPSDLVRMGSDGRHVTLARGVCDGCDVGGAAVPAVIDETVAAATALLAVHGRRLEVTVLETDRLDRTIAPRTLSRRDLFQTGWSQARTAGAAALAPLERLAPPDAVDDERPALPAEHQRRLRALELADLADDAPVPWRLPEVLDGCIFCPACTRVCPTDAIRRVFDDTPDGGGGGMRIELEATRCVGCDACVDVCPVHVVRMRDEVTWGEATAPARTLATSPAPRGPEGSVPRGPS
jgi:formate hydrogenlyase subunit 6/NADH:ubiquinone oxidoreductase subunit I